MPREGMVHALELLHRALIPQGILVDLRPARRMSPGRHSAGFPQVYCVAGDRRLHAGHLQPLKPLAYYRAADHAVQKVIQRGLFAPEATAVFPFIFYFGSPGHFDKALATRWTDTTVPASTRRRVGFLIRKSPTSQIIAVEHLGLKIMRKP